MVQALATCHPDKILHQRSTGLCHTCYNKTRRRAKNITYEQPTEFSKLRSRLKHLYKLSYPDYLTMLEKQEYKCAVCGVSQETLSVDHDHETGRIRGLLCRKCNSGIGLLGDTIESVQRALAYLGRRESDAAFMVEGVPPASKNVICVDFDGTIYPRDDLFGYPKPFNGVVQTIQGLYNQGYYIVIWTSRLSEQWFKDEGWNLDEAYKQQVSYIVSILKRDNIPYHKLTSEKVPALAYIDDKAIRFEDNWATIAERWGINVTE